MDRMEMVCIVCPMGCRLQIKNPEDAPEISGNQCPRGEEYALMELINPTRMVTSTVAVTNASLTRLPVKTSAPIPKALVFPCMAELAQLQVQGPVRMGDVILKDLFKTGVDVIATRSLD